MTRTKILLCVLLLWPVLVSSQAARADHACPSCGCRKVKKITRLAKMSNEVQVPQYQCAPAESFYPEKGTVCHSGYRCDTYYTPHTCWHCQERCVHQESCEHVVHHVDKGHCGTPPKCFEEHHHKEHVEYEVECTCHGCMSCRTECGCKTLHGASPHGCFEETWIKKPTGAHSKCVVPEVRWVTVLTCTDCARSWPCDAIQLDATTDPGLAKVPPSPGQANRGNVVELAQPFARHVSTTSSARRRPGP